ncbi:DUF47 domain-containing protein [Deinococcus malanensis]|uniref:DUF47 domain-containing protein n=1 Tax=Deinococcus malanensis TaxID=1706855 RepID=UPI0036438A3B
MVLSKFMPHNPKFSAKFAESARNAHLTAQALVDLLENYTDVERKVQRVRDLEHEGDRLSREITNLLAESFIVPFDREDIIALNDELDDLVDDMEDAARKLSLYGVQAPATDGAACPCGRAPVRAAGRGHAHDRGHPQGPDLARIAVEIRKLEDEGDTISDEVQRTLYQGVNDVHGMIRAMRGGEIVDLIEDASDQAQRVAKTVESILLKNA